MSSTEAQNAVDIATLQADYRHLDTRVVELRDEMRTSMTGVNTKLDGISQQLAAQKVLGSLRVKAFSIFTHISAGALPILAAKWLHIPLSIG